MISVKLDSLLKKEGTVEAKESQTFNSSRREFDSERRKGAERKRDCQALKKKEQHASDSQREDKSADASIAAEWSGADSGDVLSVTAGVRCSDKWILDSACSYQRCPHPHKEFFSTYEPGYFDMGNNAVCKKVGFGTVELKMHDGMTRTLTGVRHHVPDLRKNLVSFSVLSEEGCRFSGDAEVLKVCKGALVVMKLVNSMCCRAQL